MQESKKNGNIHLHSEKSISQQSKISHVPNSRTNKNLKIFSETKKNFNHKIDSKLFSQNDKE